MARSKKKEDPPRQQDEADSSTVEEVENRFNLLKNLQVKTGSLKKEISAYRRSVRSGESGADKQREKIESKISDILESWEQEKMEIRLQLAEMGLKIYKERKIFPKGVSKDIKSFKKKVENKDRKGAEELSGRIKERMDEDLADQNDVILMEAWNGFEKGVDSFREVAESPAPLKEAKKYYKKAWGYAKKGDVPTNYDG